MRRGLALDGQCRSPWALSCMISAACWGMDCSSCRLWRWCQVHWGQGQAASILVDVLFGFGEGSRLIFLAFGVKYSIRETHGSIWQRDTCLIRPKEINSSSI
jgi:hypothetical protein